MKKFLVLFIMMSSLLLAKGKIDGDILKLDLNEGIKVKLSETKSGELRVTAFRDEKIKVVEKEFFIEKEMAKSKIVKEKNMYKIGKYYIEDSETGFSVYSENKKLYYKSDFTYEKEKFRELKKCMDEEEFHGMGESAYMNSISSMKFIMHQVSEYSNQAQMNIPFYFSTGGDAFYYNSQHNDALRFGRKRSAEVKYMPQSEYIDYYFYHNANLKGLVSDFYNFSDSKSLIPKWAFGYIQSKYGYKNEKEVYDLIAEFKKREIPLSALVLDVQWFKHMGDLDWDKEAWPNHEKMDKDLEDSGIKMITISEPFFTVDSKNYDEFKKEGILSLRENGEVITWSDWWCFGSEYGGIVNPIAPNAKKIWGQKYIDMKNTGIDGYWTDLGEPESTPSEAMFNKYSENQFHNYYNREWSKLVYEVHNEAFPDERLFNMTRSAYTGSAKYNVSIWSGDVSSSFKALKRQVGIALNAGVTGFSYWGSDVGGFVSNEKIPSKELFIRWMQFGTFSPVFRAHGAMSSREPWIHDEEATNIISDYIKLRYEMLPYIYSTAHETYEDGIPMLRGVYLENQNDIEAHKRRYEFYFGEYLLVAPVFNRLNKKQTLGVYLPEGNWYDFYTYKKYESGKYTLDLTLDKIPVFIEEGAILPFENSINLFPKKEGITEFDMYNDDGVSNDYLKGKFEKIKINLSSEAVEFNGVKEARVVKIKLIKDNVEIKNMKDYKEDDNFYYFDIDLKLGNNKLEF